MMPVSYRIVEKVLFRECLNSAFSFSVRKAGLFVKLCYKPDVQQRGEDDGHFFLAGDDSQDTVSILDKAESQSF